MVRGLTEPVSAAKFLPRHANFGVTQEANDLLFGRPLLHIQSIYRSGLTSNQPATQSREGVEGLMLELNQAAKRVRLE